MASKLLIYLTPIIICIIFFYLSTGVDGQDSPQPGRTFLFDRNNRNLEKKIRNNNQKRTEQEKALRRQQRLERQRNKHKKQNQQTNGNTQVNQPNQPAAPASPNTNYANQQRTTQTRVQTPNHQVQQQPSTGQSDPRITTEYVWQRLQALEQRVSTAMRHLTQQQQKIVEIESRSSGHKQGAAPQAGHMTMMGPMAKKFSEEPRCPNGAPDYYHAPEFNSCYHLEPNNVYVNWTEASSICRGTHKNAYLVALETEAEHEYLKAKWMVERGIATISRFWTSGMKKRGRWRWESTRRVIGPFTNWIPTTAHDDENFNCIAVYSNEAYYWGDVACWHPHLVTCEIRL